jgi:hypothetical protein
MLWSEYQLGLALCPFCLASSPRPTTLLASDIETVGKPPITRVANVLISGHTVPDYFYIDAHPSNTYE